MSGGLGALSAALGKDLGSTQMSDSACAEPDGDARVLPVIPAVFASFETRLICALNMIFLTGLSLAPRQTNGVSSS